MTDQPKELADLIANCQPGEERGEYIPDDGPPRVWDGEKWLSPRAALEAGIVDKYDIQEELTATELGDLVSYDGIDSLWKIPGFFVLDLKHSDYVRGRPDLEFYENLEEAKDAFWEAVKETVRTGEIEPSDIGRKVQYRSVYSEDGGGGFWETAEVYDCHGFAVIDYGSFPETCNVPRIEIHDTVEDAKSELESFVDGLESDAQGNIDYRWEAKVWDEGGKVVRYEASWQEDEEEEEEEGDEDQEDEDSDEDEDDEDGAANEEEGEGTP